MQDLAEERLGAFVLGLVKNGSGSLTSMIWPASINTIRVAACRAKPISWLTTSMVMPSMASATMVSSTSLTISGSSAEVGSSNSMIFGLHAERPRDRHPLLLAAGELRGIFRRLLGDAYPFEIVRARSPPPPCAACLRTQIGASVQFSSTRQMRKQVELLEHHADLAAHLVDRLEVFGQLDAVDDDAALLPVLDPVDAAEQRRLAASPTARR